MFAGGFEEDAVIEVCSGPGVPASRIADLLGALTEKSILQRQLVGSSARYWLLDTLRQYGQWRLRELGEETTTLKRHLGWICVLAKSIGAWDDRQVEASERAVALRPGA